MNDKLASALTGIAVTLAALHGTGVKLGHVSGTDFIALAEQMVDAALSAFTPHPA